jgi:hypothetical protein
MQTSVGEWLEITICVLDALLHTREVVKNDLNVESNAVTEHIASLLLKKKGWCIISMNHFQEKSY